MKANKAKLTCAYLYADGHAALVYEKTDKQAGTIKWVELIEKYGPECNFKGRIIFSNPSWYEEFDLAKTCTRIYAQEPSLTHGSDNTRERNIAVGSITFHFKSQKTMHFNQFRNLISSSMEYQPDTSSTFDSKTYFWGSYNVTKIHEVKRPSQPLTVNA